MGIVEAVGPDVHGFKPGQRVTACPWPTEGGEGTWQQLVLVPAKSLVRGMTKLLVRAAFGTQASMLAEGRLTSGPANQSLLPALARVYQQLWLRKVLEQGCHTSCACIRAAATGAAQGAGAGRPYLMHMHQGCNNWGCTKCWSRDATPHVHASGLQQLGLHRVLEQGCHTSCACIRAAATGAAQSAGAGMPYPMRMHQGCRRQPAPQAGTGSSASQALSSALGSYATLLGLQAAASGKVLHRYAPLSSVPSTVI